MGSSSHGGERKGQLGPAITVPMSGTHLKRDEGWDPTVDAFQVISRRSSGTDVSPHNGGNILSLK